MTFFADRKEQLVGEVALLLPLVFVANIMGILWYTMSAMIVVFVGKWTYQVKGHFHFEDSERGNRLCKALTYGTFLGVGVIAVGLGVTIPFLYNQPMVSILLALCVLVVSAFQGDKQFYEEEKDRVLASQSVMLYEAERIAVQAKEDAVFRRKIEVLKAFRLEPGCDERKFRELAELKQLDVLETELLVMKYCKCLSVDDIQIKQGGTNTIRTIYNHLEKARNKFNSPLEILDDSIVE